MGSSARCTLGGHGCSERAAILIQTDAARRHSAVASGDDHSPGPLEARLAGYSLYFGGPFQWTRPKPTAPAVAKPNVNSGRKQLTQLTKVGIRTTRSLAACVLLSEWGPLRGMRSGALPFASILGRGNAMGCKHTKTVGIKPVWTHNKGFHVTSQTRQP